MIAEAVVAEKAGACSLVIFPIPTLNKYSGFLQNE
jgi:hypothetical protein